MKFTLQRRTDLAIRTLNVLAESGTRWRASELAEAIDSTPEFIPQVLAPLVRARWVESRRGPSGSVRNVIEAVEGSIDTASCVLRGVPCGGLAREPPGGVRKYPHIVRVSADLG